MSELRDDTAAHRFEMDFPTADGRPAGQVWADYATRGDAHAILHVEAEPQLRGSGASGHFMQALAEHARAEGLRLQPVCGYAVAWHKRHKDFDDVLA